MRTKSVCLLLASLSIAFAVSNVAARPGASGDVSYTTSDKEYYLSTEQLLFIRPGLVLEITDVVIPADRQPEVTFRITDSKGLGLDRNGVTTPGPVSTSFILSFIPAEEASYVAYTTRVQTSPITDDSAVQASTDTGGVYTDLGDGNYRYKFGTVLPQDYDANATHTLGMYARRDLREFELDRYVANELHHFVPSGMSAPAPRNIVTTETCNGRCHNPLALHGGSRQKVGLCILCHNPSQGIDPDTGNSVDFPFMVHKIHRGAHLTKDYTIIGYRQGEHNWSDVEFPAELNDCEVCHTGGTPTESFPLVANPNPVLACDKTGKGTTQISWGDLDAFEIHMGSASGSLFASGVGPGSKETTKWVRDGTVFVLVDKASGATIQELRVDATVLGCQGNAPGAFRGEAGVQHSNWMDHPSRKICGSCHDDVNFATGENHSKYEIIMPDDTFCANCHRPYSTTEEYGISVRGAHKPRYKASQLPGVMIDILSVTDTNPGDTPTVTFALAQKKGNLRLANLDFFRLYIAGPNKDFSFLAQEDARGAVWNGENWSYTFTTPLPADANGSFTAGAEAFRMTPIQIREDLVNVRGSAENDHLAFAVTDAMPVPRRMVVDDAKCENCHSNLAHHGGGIRHDPQYCVGCHSPGKQAFSEGEGPVWAESVHFKYMIHKIHRGENLENGYATPDKDVTVDFSGVAFPGDLRDCDTCHVNESEQLPLPADLLPTVTPQAWWDPTLPIAAACLSCHDGDAAAAHAASNTAVFGESCSVCHGVNMEFSIDKVHAH